MHNTKVSFNRFLTGAILLVLPVLLFAGCGRSPQAVRQRAMAAGRKLMQKGDYRRAVLEFKNAVQAMPRDEQAHYELGNAYAGAGDVAAAASAYRKALELNPKKTEAEQKLTALMTLLGDRSIVEEAERRLHVLLDASPADMTALNTLAFAELKLGKNQEAIRHLEGVLAHSPQQLASAVLLAQAKLAEKDVAGAEQVLKTAASQNANSSEAAVLLGRFYTGTNRLAEADQQFQQALKIQPRSASALFYAGMLDNIQGRKQAAEERFKLLSTHPEKVYRPVYGMFLFQEDRKTEAVREFERLYQEDREDRTARTRLVAVYEAVNRIDDAEKVITAVLGRNPKDVHALLQRGALRLARAHYADAQNDLNQVLHENPSLPEAHFLQARIYEKNGSTLTQRQELNETLRLNPLFLPARIALAHLLTAANATKTALQLLDETPPEQKASLAVLVERNWVFAALGNIVEMEKGVQQGMAVLRTPDLLVQNALLNLNRKNFSGARTSAEEALRSAPEDIRALEVLARSYAQENQASLGIARLREYASRRPQSAPVQLFLGKWLQAQGDLPAARAALSTPAAAGADTSDRDLALAQMDLLEAKWADARQRVMSILGRNPGSITARYWLAQVEEIQGNRAASIEQYRKVVAADPTHANALNNLSVLLAETGNPAEALPLAQRAKELSPDSPVIADTLGWVLYRNGLYSLAVRHLEEANTRQATARRACHLSMAYWKAGSPERARQALQRAAKMDPSLPDLKEAQTVLGVAARAIGR